MKGFVAKTALAAAVVVAPVVGMSAGTASATPVWGGAYVVAYPWWGTNAHWSNLQIASAFGPSNLTNNVFAESARGCWGCNALAVNVQVDLVSYTNTPPNESDVATVVDKGNGNDQNLAAAAMFVVTSPGRVSLSGSGWAQLGSIEWQLRSLQLKGTTVAAVQGTVTSLLGQVVSILESDVTTSTPQTSTAGASPTTAVTPAVAPAVAPAATSGVTVTSNIQFNS
jgi:hypothetical protein